MATLAQLNGLQCMMLRWEEFHALNAVHVIQLGASHDPDFVHRTIIDRCDVLGMSPVEFIRHRRAIRYSDTTDDGEHLAIPFRSFQLQGPTWQSLERFLKAELNTPFPAGLHWPLRFWLVDSEQDGQFLVLNYQHAISDSRGISLLLREIVRALHGNGPVIESLDRCPPPLSKMLPEKLTIRGMVKRGMELVHELNSSATCFHHPRRFSGGLEIESGFQQTTFPTALLKQSARRLNVKVQDLLFASLLEALSLHFTEELRSTGRKTLAVYAPADLRRESVLRVDTAVGQLLGCITARMRVDARSSFRELVKNVAVQTTRIKEAKSHRDHALHMNIMSRIWDTFPRIANRTVGPYLVPLSGFISNVNLTDFLSDEVTRGQVRNYFRFSGTGILTPMMLGLTTVGENCNLTTTHHQNVFSSEQMARIARHVQWRVEGELDKAGDQDRFHQHTLVATNAAASNESLMAVAL